MIRGHEVLKRWKKEQSENKNAVQNFPTHTPERVGNFHTEGSPPWEEDTPAVQNFPTQNGANDEKPLNSIMGKSHTYTATQLPGSGDGEQQDQVSRPDPAPQIASGPNALDEAALAIREKVGRHFYDLTPAKQRAFAAAHSVQVADVKQYVVGDPHHLPAPKVAAMAVAIRNLERERRAAKAAAKAARTEQQGAGA